MISGMKILLQEGVKENTHSLNFSLALSNVSAVLPASQGIYLKKS